MCARRRLTDTRHFATFLETDAFPDGFHDGVFLVADESSVKSYTEPLPESTPPGDSGGNVLMVDSYFDPADPANRPDESPGFDGTMRVLGSLLCDDLSPMLMMQMAVPVELWPLAMNHPRKLYVGPVVPAQEEKWSS